MEACSLLLPFRDLSFLLFYAESLFTMLQVLLMFYFCFLSCADLCPFFFPRLQSLLLCFGNWGGLLLSPPSLFSSSYPSCLYSLCILPFFLLFIHPHLCFSFLFLSCMQPCSTPLYFPTLFFNALHRVACFSIVNLAP